MNNKRNLLISFIDAIPEGIISLDMEGNITYVNKGVIDILGYKSFNLIGKPIYDFAPSFEREGIEGFFRDLVDSPRPIKSRRIRLYDVTGRLRDISISFSLLKDKNENTSWILCTISDNGGNSADNKEQADSHGLYGILQNAGVNIVLTDLKGNITFASSGAREIFGELSGDPIGQNVIKNSPEPLALNDKFLKLILTGDSFEYESSVSTGGRAKSYAHVFSLIRDESGEPAEVVLVTRDMSGLKLAENRQKITNTALKNYARELENLIFITQNIASLTEKDRINESLVNASRKILDVHGSLLFLNPKKGKNPFLASAIGIDEDTCIKINQGMETSGLNEFLMGLRAPKLVSKKQSWEFPKFPPLSRELNFISAIYAPILLKDSIFGVLMVFLKNQREFKREEVDVLQSIANIAAIAFENSNLYDEIKLALDDLKELDTLKHDIISNVSHELKTPITIIQGCMEMALSEEDPDQKEILKEMIQNSLKRQETIINNLLIVSNIGWKEPNKRMDNIMDLIRKAVMEKDGFAGKRNVSFEFDIDKELPLVPIDRIMISHVLKNLIDNAVKFNKEDGSVKIGVGKDGDFLLVSIMDTGIGIEEDNLEKIFEPLTQLDSSTARRYEGAGQGLAVVKKIVDSHGGDIWVESDYGKGSIFYFRLPLWK